VLLDVIPPFPTFAEAFLRALRDLDKQVAAAQPLPADGSPGPGRRAAVPPPARPG
jgi:hypothetical protein